MLSLSCAAKDVVSTLLKRLPVYGFDTIAIAKLLTASLQVACQSSNVKTTIDATSIKQLKSLLQTLLQRMAVMRGSAVDVNKYS
jgi:hypothetical protein